MVLRKISALSFILFISSYSAGCTAHSGINPSAAQFAEIIKGHSSVVEPIRIARLTARSSADVPPSRRPSDISIVVHPAYSVFFDDVLKKDYSGSKYDLLKKQLENEARFMRSQAAYGNIVILVLPADSVSASMQSAYASYLNGITLNARTVFYVFSETASSGSLPMEHMVSLYQFIQEVKAKKVLIAGGYIGRCQKEFFNQLARYFSSETAYLVPEVSTISPEDVSDREAEQILLSIRRHDYGPVRDYINRKTAADLKIISVPQ